MWTVIETPVFARYAEDLWSRVIYFLRNDRGEIVLLIVYAKAKFDTLSAQFLKRLKEAFNGS
jgi:hypothetical protein